MLSRPVDRNLGALLVNIGSYPRSDRRLRPHLHLGTGRLTPLPVPATPAEVVDQGEGRIRSHVDGEYATPIPCPLCGRAGYCPVCCGSGTLHDEFGEFGTESDHSRPLAQKREPMNLRPGATAS